MAGPQVIGHQHDHTLPVLSQSPAVTVTCAGGVLASGWMTDRKGLGRVVALSSFRPVAPGAESLAWAQRKGSLRFLHTGLKANGLCSRLRLLLLVSGSQLELSVKLPLSFLALAERPQYCLLGTGVRVPLGGWIHVYDQREAHFQFTVGKQVTAKTVFKGLW